MQLYDEMRKRAPVAFNNRGCHPPVFVFPRGGMIGAIQSKWSNNAEQALALREVSQAIHASGANCYVFTGAVDEGFLFCIGVERSGSVMATSWPIINGRVGEPTDVSVSGPLTQLFDYRLPQ
jgi:hypothetical protein